MRSPFRGKKSQLTLDFGPFSHQREPPQGCLFQRVKSEMLKRKERMAMRRKPIEYEKLEMSLQSKLKQKTFNKEEQRDQLIMLEKCKNYFQLRRTHQHPLTPHQHPLTPNLRKSQPMSRPHSSCSSLHKQNFLSQLQEVMKCCSDEGEVREDLQLFGYYCKMMDRRLAGIKNNIERKERMV